MRTNNNSLFFFTLLWGVVLSSLLFVGCSTKWDDMNIDPNSPSTVNPDFLFTESLLLGAGEFNTGVHTEIWTLMVWNMQMADMAGLDNPSEPYLLSGNWNDELWKFWYSRVLIPIEQVIQISKEDELMTNKHQLARIWKAYIFHRITDLWGDVPYSEALKGYQEGEEPDLSPKYDSQEQIYTDLLKELREATQLIDFEKTSFGNADPIYQGNLDKWIAFANSLRMRIALRISGKNMSLAQSEFDDILGSGQFIDSKTKSAYFPFVSGDYSPFHELYITGQGMRNPSHFLIEKLKSKDDPRLNQIAEPTPESQILGFDGYVGIPNLQGTVELENFSDFNSSAVGSQFLQSTFPGKIFSYSESCFILSEAGVNGISPTIDSEFWYKEGVQSSMQELNVSQVDIDAFLADKGAFVGTIEQIQEQKWISFTYSNGFESFAEIRRTHFPKLELLDGSSIDWTSFPRRIPYPPSEFQLNGDNVNNVGIGTNDYNSPLWWDIN